MLLFWVGWFFFVLVGVFFVTIFQACLGSWALLTGNECYGNTAQLNSHFCSSHISYGTAELLIMSYIYYSLHSGGTQSPPTKTMIDIKFYSPNPFCMKVFVILLQEMFSLKILHCKIWPAVILASFLQK